MIPIKPLVVGCPFGNYIQPKHATATLGTFTLAQRPPGTEDNPARGGRLIQILKTVRYNPFNRSWRNKIGLRNPGIEWLMRQVRDFKIDVSDKIVSIHGFNADDWVGLRMLMIALKPLAVELNVSCPNVKDALEPRDVIGAMASLQSHNIPLIVKLPPIDYWPVVGTAWDAGIRCFHACNTIPSPKGGISGKPLKPMARAVVSSLRDVYGDKVQIIGGGGITSRSDAEQYRNEGADHVSVASCLFFPWNIIKMSMLARRYAEQTWAIN
jgi:dihydroorotate dehydrogenase